MARELVLQMLFQADMGQQDYEQVRKIFWAERSDVDVETRGFADDLFRVAENEAERQARRVFVRLPVADMRLERRPIFDPTQEALLFQPAIVGKLTIGSAVGRGH